MENTEIKTLLEKNLKSLTKAAENSSRSDEELKALTEAIEINIKLLKACDFTPCDSNGHYLTRDESITNPLIED